MLFNSFLFLVFHALQITTDTFSVFPWNDPSMSLMHGLVVDIEEPLVSAASQHYMQARYSRLHNPQGPNHIGSGLVMFLHSSIHVI